MRTPPKGREWVTGWVDCERELAGPGPVLDFAPVIESRLCTDPYCMKQSHYELRG